MKDGRVATLLLCTILVTTGVPLVASFYFLDDALERSLNLGFNPQIEHALAIASQNLKTLKTLDAANEAHYREEFERISNLAHVYSEPQLLKRAMRDSLKVYFGVGLVGAVLMAVLVAIALGRKINRSYRLAFDELMRHRDRVHYLEQMSSWQELARILAHEIKNPLTPIEVMVTALSRAHEEKTPAQFREQLSAAQAMIGEEISHLKTTVSRFSDFARLPPAQLAIEDPVQIVRGHLTALSAIFDNAELRLRAADCPVDLRARIDSSLMRQVLTNIVANGVEANPGRRIGFDITIQCDAHTLRIAVSNNGVPVPPDIARHMFDPYISGKAGRDNVGLGLAIVKKIVIEHGGEIAYAEVGGRPCFVITLARVAVPT
jgi:signal transduction histidine kinase